MWTSVSGVGRLFFICSRFGTHHHLSSLLPSFVVVFFFFFSFAVCWCRSFAWISLLAALICRLTVIALHQFQCLRLNCFLSSAHFHIQRIADIRFEFVIRRIFHNFPDRFADSCQMFRVIFTMCTFIGYQLPLTVIWSHDWHSNRLNTIAGKCFFFALEINKSNGIKSIMRLVRAYHWRQTHFAQHFRLAISDLNPLHFDIWLMSQCECGCVCVSAHRKWHLTTNRHCFNAVGVRYAFLEKLNVKAIFETTKKSMHSNETQDFLRKIP